MYGTKCEYPETALLDELLAPLAKVESYEKYERASATAVANETLLSISKDIQQSPVSPNEKGARAPPVHASGFVANVERYYTTDSDHASKGSKMRSTCLLK